MEETEATPNPPMTTLYPGIACLLGGALGCAVAAAFGAISPAGFAPFAPVLVIDALLTILGIVLVALKKPLQKPAEEVQPGEGSNEAEKASAFKTKVPAKGIGIAVFVIVAIAFAAFAYLALTKSAIYLYGAIFCTLFWATSVLKYSSQALETPLLEGISQAAVN